MAGEKISLKYSELNLTEILVAVEIRDLKKSQIQHRCISWIRNPKNGQEWNLDVFEKNLCVCTLDDCLLTADEWNKWRRCTWTVQLVSGSAFLLCGWRRGSYWYFPHGIFSLFAPPPSTIPVVIPSVNTDLYSFNQYLQIELFGGHCCNRLIHPYCAPITRSSRNYHRQYSTLWKISKHILYSAPKPPS